MLVGLDHDIFPCTSIIQYEIVDSPPPRKVPRVIIVDTPGFDNLNEDDDKIVGRLADWLASS